MTPVFSATYDADVVPATRGDKARIYQPVDRILSSNSEKNVDGWQIYTYMYYICPKVEGTSKSIVVISASLSLAFSRSLSLSFKRDLVGSGEDRT